MKKNKRENQRVISKRVDPDETIDYTKLKRGGEWDLNRVEDHLSHLMSSMNWNDFLTALNAAKIRSEHYGN